MSTVRTNSVVVAQDTALQSEQQHSQKRFVSTINKNVAILIYSVLHALKNQRSAMLVEHTNNSEKLISIFALGDLQSQTKNNQTRPSLFVRSTSIAER